MARQSTVKKALEKESLRERGFVEPRIVLLEDEPDIPDTSVDVEPESGTRKRPNLIRAAVVALLAIASAGIWLTNAYFRKNSAIIDPGLQYQHQIAVRDVMRNGHTDLIYWRGSFRLIHATTPAGLEQNESKLALLSRSPNSVDWNPVADFQPPPGGAFRRACFAAIGNRLYLYAALSGPEVSTLVSYSENGRDWSDLEALGHGGALSRPKTRDALTWYSTANVDGHTMLLRSSDGLAWEEVSEIHRGGEQETDIEFLPDGRMLVLGSITPSGSPFASSGHTIVATAFPPYTSWETNRVWDNRLGSPCLFRYRNDIYVMARSTADPGSLSRVSDSFTRHRTAIFRVEPNTMEWLTDLPSGGDTAGAAVLIQGDKAFGSYYSSDVSRDWPQFLGEQLPTDIHYIQFDLTSLE